MIRVPPGYMRVEEVALEVVSARVEELDKLYELVGKAAVESDTLAIDALRHYIANRIAYINVVADRPPDHQNDTEE